jgi:hypothetical protein
MASGEAPVTPPSASSGTAAVAMPQIANGPTNALVADPQAILRNRIMRNKLFPIITPLRWDRWRDRLLAAGWLVEFADVPIGLHDGFRIGVSSQITSTFSPPNHKSAFVNSDFIDEQIRTEIAEGCYSEGLDPAAFLATYGPYRTSPLGISFNPNNNKPHLIQDHSFPCNDPCMQSVNAEIDGSAFKCDWGSFADCFLRVLDAPPGTQVAVFDVDAAHRRMPVTPEDRLHVCVAWNNKVHMDHYCCFGCTSSSGIFGHVTDTIVVIYHQEGVDAIVKWADDFTFWRIPIIASDEGPWTYRYDESLIWRIGDDLGWPWSKKPGKCIPFAVVFQYVGFLWDLVEKSVALPDAKRKKFLAKLSTWLAGTTVSFEECLSVIGSLNHCSVVIFASRTRLPSLYRLSSRFQKHSPFVKLTIPSDVLTDISWWHEALSSPSRCKMPILRRPPPSDLRIYVDVSTSWEMGLVMEDRWLAWRLADGWESDGQNIGWAEMLALEFAVLTLIACKAPPAMYKIFSDNYGVVDAFKASCSRSPLQNAILRHILILLQDHNLWIEMVWVASEDNLADGPSCGIFPSFDSLIPTPPSIPRPLRTFVCPAASRPQ